MRLKCPANFRIIRLPCTGKIDVIHILRAFEKGADGVYVVGCMEGDCHFKSGNFRARKRVEQAAKILDQIGVGGERVKMYNLSSGEGPLFAQYSIEMDNKIRELGPNPVKVALQAKKQAA
ncbi:MAG: hydrogenase iron-sulfur subunit [Desulfamplus sp.]|nr:hydrogenase iron-sulfur subunit [Desulfamplus sp.]MBF0242029.1 hydrogenase iron-sulfur subunit [Desulfamplus sp.]MBF0389954.1 hydrogenase iron-sulfur subunit [Desulfamplus sp.]